MDPVSSQIPEPSFEELSDEALAARCRDELPDRLDSFHEILNRYESMVFHTCLRMIGNAQEAEETCQDVFIRLFHKIGQFEGRSLFKTWLFRVVHNLCLTRRRSLAIRRERKTEVETEITRVGEVARAEAEWIGADVSEKVHRAIRELKEDDQEVLLLRFISELSLEEIAEVLGIGLSATKMRLYRAMERFKVIYLSLEEELDGPDSTRVGKPQTA